MAKPKVKQSKTKKPSTKYSKLLVVASKELTARKKALIQAERNLAKSKQKHEELVAEVARLDMVERSLKATVEGTEPPTNVKYIYQYPQWVWYPSQPYIYYTWPYYQQPQGNWQGNTVSIPASNITTTVPQGNTFTYNNAAPSMVFTNNSGSLPATFSSSNLVLTSCTSGSNSLTAAVNNVTLDSSASVDASLGALQPAQQNEGLVVDLTTHAELTDAPAECGECGAENDGAIEMHRLECSKAKEA